MGMSCRTVGVKVAHTIVTKCDWHQLNLDMISPSASIKKSCPTDTVVNSFLKDAEDSGEEHFSLKVDMRRVEDLQIN